MHDWIRLAGLVRIHVFVVLVLLNLVLPVWCVSPVLNLELFIRRGRGCCPGRRGSGVVLAGWRS